MEIVKQGYDPTIGYLHTQQKDRAALVFDLMEPLRPVVDLRIVEFVLSQIFEPADFVIRNDGICRLNPEIARHLATLIETKLGQAATVGLLLGGFRFQ